MVSPTGYVIRQKLSFIITSLLEISIVSLFIVHVATNTCVNQNNCGYLAARDECYIHPEDMLDRCPLSCLNPCRCNVSAYTNDTACDCLLKVRTGYCSLPQSLVDCPTTCAIANSVNCGYPPPPNDTNAYLLLSSNSTTFLSSVVELCNPGYRPDRERDQGKKTCLKDGTWHNDFFNGHSVNCLMVDCKEPPIAQNTTVSYTGTTEGSEASYTCNKGYIGRNNANHTTLTCMNNETWSGNRLDCEKIDCGLPPAPVGANVTYLTTFYGDQANYECYVDYKYQSGDLVLTCAESATWEGVVITCDKIDCQSPPIVPHATVNTSGDTTYGHTATYTCQEGYTDVSNTLVLTCESSGQWTGPNITCSIIDCHDPPKWPDTVVEVTNTTYGYRAKYTCSSGYESPVGQIDLICSPDGQWTGSTLICSKKDCGSPGRGNGTLVAYNTTLFESQAAYSCDTGFELVEGDDVRTCASDGQWTGRPLECTAVVCGDAPIYPGAHRWVSQVQGQFKFKDQAHYQCFFPEPGKEGLQWILECGSQKQWIGAEPQCGGTSTTTDSYDRPTVDTSSTPTNDDKYTWFLGAGILGMVVSVGAFFMIIYLTVHSKHPSSKVHSLRKSLSDSKNTKIKPIHADNVKLP